MTTSQLAPDWKTTAGRRIALRLSATLVALSAYAALIAVVLDATGAWWAVAGLALAAMVLAAFAPEPVPSDLITGEGPRRTR
ncbi:MAG: hypothetical protein R3290_00800 [Acidimicrobiia bacterium]|nr:hypothetical protein [Acidimicrobiia bacterium]